MNSVVRVVLRLPQDHETRELSTIADMADEITDVVNETRAVASQ